MIRLTQIINRRSLISLAVVATIVLLMASQSATSAGSPGPTEIAATAAANNAAGHSTTPVGAGPKPGNFLDESADTVLEAAEPLMPISPSDGSSFVGYVPNQIVVSFKASFLEGFDPAELPLNNMDDAALDALGDSHGVTRISRQFPGAEKLSGPWRDLSRWHVIQFSGAVDADAVARDYKSHPEIEDAQPIGIHRINEIPNDGFFGFQWFLDQISDVDIDAPEAWNIEDGDEGIVAAVLDTGVRYFHRDLGGANASFSAGVPDPSTIDGNVWRNTAEINGVAGSDDDANGMIDDFWGWDFVSGLVGCFPGEDCSTQDNDPRDFNGHGTHVAGIVGALTNNAYASAGVAGGYGDGNFQAGGDGVKIMPLRVGWSAIFGGAEAGFVRMDFAAQALYYAGTNGAKLANGSWGSSNSGGLGAAMDAFIAGGGLFFHAAGNSNNTNQDYLASRSDVINVASTAQDDQKSSFSSYGSWVDISAPGSSILSSYHVHSDEVNDYVATLGGTSMASPVAMGVAALIWSANPSWSPAQVKQRLFSTADNIDAANPGFIGQLGAGRVNAFNAVADTVAPTDPSPSSTSHTVNVESSDNTVDIAWPAVDSPGGATDDFSGVDGYSWSFTQGASDVPDQVKDNEADALTATSSPLAAGDWWFHLRTVDAAGNWTATVHLGPFVIATAPTIVKNIMAGVAGSDPQFLTDVNGTLFFSAESAWGGRELWKSDGTSGGTVQVKSIVSGAGSSNPQSLTDVNGTLFFTAESSWGGRELWKSDGTNGGTVQVKGIVPGVGSSDPQSLTNVNGTLYFTASTPGSGRELWKSDGTGGGTVLVKDIKAGGVGSDPLSLTDVGGTLFFTATLPWSGRELWKSDGTGGGTVLVKDMAGAASSDPQSLTDVNGTLFFTASLPWSGRELWKSDGTNGGTVLVKNLAGAASSDPQSLTDVGGTLFFTVDLLWSGRELWKSDGTGGGTVLVKNLAGAASSDPQSLTDVNGTLFFTASLLWSGRELWKSDGTNGGTVLVKNMAGAASSDPQSLTDFGGILFFTANLPWSGRELWKSDGTGGGTALVKNLAGAASSDPQWLTDVGGTLFFTADLPWSGRELWKK